MKFNVTFMRTLTQFQEITVSAKNKDAAMEKAEALIDKGLKEKSWESGNGKVEIFGFINRRKSPPFSLI